MPAVLPGRTPAALPWMSVALRTAVEVMAKCDRGTCSVVANGSRAEPPGAGCRAAARCFLTKCCGDGRGTEGRGAEDIGGEIGPSRDFRRGVTRGGWTVSRVASC